MYFYFAAYSQKAAIRRISSGRYLGFATSLKPLGTHSFVYKGGL